MIKNIFYGILLFSLLSCTTPSTYSDYNLPYIEHPLDKYSKVDKVEGNPNEIISGLKYFLERNKECIMIWDVRAYSTSLNTNDIGKIVEVDSTPYLKTIKNILNIDFSSIPSVTKIESANIRMSVKYVNKKSPEGHIRVLTLRDETTVHYMLEDLSTNIILGQNSFTYTYLQALKNEREGETKVIIMKWE